MKPTWIALTLAFAGVSASEALAGPHESRSQLRPYVAGNFYLGEQVQASLSQFSLTGYGEKDESLAMNGMALKTSMGIEHLRCLQTGVFYVNLNQSNTQKGLKELQGHEFGGEAKLSFNSPLANVAVGGGGFYSSARYRAATDALSLSGTGWFAAVEVSYYLSSRVSLMFSGNRVEGQYQKGNYGDEGLRGKAVSTRLGAGLLIWL